MALKEDDNRNVIPTGSRFTTENVVLAAADTLEEITKPAKAVEVHIKSESEFTLAESETGDGFYTDDIILGISSSAAKIWVKGAINQSISIIWIYA